MTKKYSVILIKLKNCPACINFMNDWFDIITTHSYQDKINFETLEITNEYDKKIIDNLNFEIKHFPTILILRNNEIMGEFKQSRNLLKDYLLSLK